MLSEAEQARLEALRASGFEALFNLDYEKARLEFRNALQIDPKDGKLQHLAGTAAEKVGNYDEAAALYQAAITTDKSNLKAQADLARLYLFGGLPEQGSISRRTSRARRPGFRRMRNRRFRLGAGWCGRTWRRSCSTSR